MIIKQLEWADGATCYAVSILGTYGVWAGYYRPPGQRAGIQAGSTIESAKAAAQSHFEAVIRSVLVVK